MKLNEVVVTYEVHHRGTGKVPGLGIVSTHLNSSLEKAQELIQRYLDSGSYKKEDFEIRELTIRRIV